MGFRPAILRGLRTFSRYRAVRTSRPCGSSGSPTPKGGCLMTLRSIHSAVIVGAGLLVFTFFSASLPAQTLYGTLVGNITDPSGLPVGGATVRAVHSGTGLARE